MKCGFWASALALTVTVAMPAHAQSNDAGWQAGLVLDTAAISRPLSLGQRDQGLGLGHSDVVLRGPVGLHLDAELIAAFHTLDHKLDTHWENVWLQTRTLPAGWQVRAGRFASQLGYWNEIHPHADDFVERGLLERAFLGGHWIDDGVRVNWTAPTSMFVRLGVEAFSGRQLVPEAQRGSGAYVLNLKMGDDLNAEHSWQWGLSRMDTRREAMPPEADATLDAESENAFFHGKSMWMSDLVWKWAPGGNSQNQQVRLVWEWAQLQRPLPSAGLVQGHSAHNLGLVWRFDRDWETGVRLDQLRVHAPNASGGTLVATPARWQEQSWMLAYKPTDKQILRFQLATQQGDAGVAGLPLKLRPGHSVMLQYILSFGAHGAHTF